MRVFYSCLKLSGGTNIDESLHQLSKEYNRLMDRYRRLKQMPHTQHTDAEISDLLTVRQLSVCMD